MGSGKLENMTTGKNLLEKDIQAQIVAYLKIKGIEHTVTNADRTWGKGGGVRQSKVVKGWPDISGVLPVKVAGLKVGLALYVEVKTRNGTIKPEQRETLNSLANAGAACVLARDVEDVVWLVAAYKGKEWTLNAKETVDEILRITLYERQTKATSEKKKELMSAANRR